MISNFKITIPFDSADFISRIYSQQDCSIKNFVLHVLCGMLFVILINQNKLNCFEDIIKHITVEE